MTNLGPIFFAVNIVLMSPSELLLNKTASIVSFLFGPRRFSMDRVAIFEHQFAHACRLLYILQCMEGSSPRLHLAIFMNSLTCRFKNLNLNPQFYESWVVEWLAKLKKTHEIESLHIRLQLQINDFDVH